MTTYIHIYFTYHIYLVFKCAFDKRHSHFVNEKYVIHCIQEEHLRKQKSESPLLQVLHCFLEKMLHEVHPSCIYTLRRFSLSQPGCQGETQLQLLGSICSKGTSPQLVVMVYVFTKDKSPGLHMVSSGLYFLYIFL